MVMSAKIGVFYSGHRRSVNPVSVADILLKEGNNRLNRSDAQEISSPKRNKKP
jgi:hypothetical protein